MTGMPRCESGALIWRRRAASRLNVVETEGGWGFECKRLAAIAFKHPLAVANIAGTPGVLANGVSQPGRGLLLAVGAASGLVLLRPPTVSCLDTGAVFPHWPFPFCAAAADGGE